MSAARAAASALEPSPRKQLESAPAAPPGPLCSVNTSALPRTRSACASRSPSAQLAAARSARTHAGGAPTAKARSPASRSAAAAAGCSSAASRPGAARELDRLDVVVREQLRSGPPAGPPGATRSTARRGRGGPCGRGAEAARRRRRARGCGRKSAASRRRLPTAAHGGGTPCARASAGGRRRPRPHRDRRPPRSPSDQTTLPMTAASRNSSFSAGGSRSTRAATIPSTVSGQAREVAARGPHADELLGVQRVAAAERSTTYARSTSSAGSRPRSDSTSRARLARSAERATP